MTQMLVALLSGLIFGLGLIASGMADPAKVLAFLDLAGRWDPSLAFVMAGAIGVALLPFRQAGRRSQSWLGADLPPPPSGRIDRRLLLGSALFGIGWGLSGFCPGPGLLGLGAAYRPAFVFVLAMLLGMIAFELLPKSADTRRAGDD